ncbi:P-loop containing nucleoside triphosphate hydrolase protein [Gloeopeniophorella convolvens]|nr:P-loop containing nucleoside triphosphate hydrolase protein [Gloeopeniophorella convolvens]
MSFVPTSGLCATAMPTNPASRNLQPQPLVASIVSIHQDEIPGEPNSAQVREYSLSMVSELESDLNPSSCVVVGVAIELRAKSTNVSKVVLSTKQEVFSLLVHNQPSPAQRKKLQNLFSSIKVLAGFEMSHTLVLLSHTLGIAISGNDLSTISVGPKAKDLTRAGNLMNAKNPGVDARVVNGRWDQIPTAYHTDPEEDPEPPNTEVRAWFTAIAASMAVAELHPSGVRRTHLVGRKMLRCLSEMAARTIRLQALNPLIQESDFTDKTAFTKGGGMTIDNARFKTRIRSSKQTHLEVQLKDGAVFHASIKGTVGRRTKAKPDGSKFTGTVSRIRVIGREERTSAEQAQYQFLGFSLVTARPIPPFAKVIWFPTKAQVCGQQDEGLYAQVAGPHLNPKLNSSQKEVASAMISTSTTNSLVIAHGPPGTGKTTTIAAAAAVWQSRKTPCWIVAQSNVGVKNIAEKLFKEKIKFRLLVSKEFHFEWHEEIYQELDHMLIRSDELSGKDFDVRIVFDGISIVLSTLSMLSNPVLDDCGLFDMIPVTTLVVDEASQIDVFEFLHLFYTWSKNLSKLCFFGDPKQLPPYGSEEAGLETIFDIKHLEKTSHFLDTQYRMPVPLGNFISQNVYNGKLQSDHSITDRSCISFIDVHKGWEVKQGKSWKNMEEVHAVVKIARRYHERGLKFCIITFYDPQRAAIAKQLAHAKLPSACVYNVDSFQGIVYFSCPLRATS